MTDPGRTRYWIITAATLVLALATLSGVERYGRGSRSYGSVAELDRGAARFLVDTPVEAYRLWKEAGACGRLVLVVADRWRLPEPGELEPPLPMSRRYPVALYRIAEVMEREYLSAANFLQVAALNGMARSTSALLSEGGYAEMLQLARAAGNGCVADGELSLPQQGYQRRFTTAAGFRGEPEPVLLYVSAGYFRQGRPEELFRLLKSRGVLSDCVILCRETGDPAVSDQQRAALLRFAALAGIPDPAGRTGAARGGS
jgi:hypothetical protein